MIRGRSRNVVVVNVVVVVIVGEEVHLGCVVEGWWGRVMIIVCRRAKVDLEGDCVDVVVGTKFPLVVVCVFGERVKNNRLVEEEAPNWI